MNGKPQVSDHDGLGVSAKTSKEILIYDARRAGGMMQEEQEGWNKRG